MEEDDEEGSGMITTFLLSQIHCFTKMVIDGPTEEPTKFFAAYKQISLIGSVPTKFTINSTRNWGPCLQAALACSPTLSDPVHMF